MINSDSIKFKDLPSLAFIDRNVFRKDISTYVRYDSFSQFGSSFPLGNLILIERAGDLWIKNGFLERE